MTTIWKINSEKIAKRHGRNTFDKLSNAEAKKIGYCYCVPYTNKEAIKEYRKGYEEEQRQRQEELMKGGSK
jgi:hypothetical protein|tara:strand:- start:794 stop:1006 length:213 start_codon:yes stop_codon:yes gene_type:complete